MESFKLIHVDPAYRDPATMLVKLWTDHRLQLADHRHVNSVPHELQDRMGKLRKKSRVIILNRRTVRGEYSTLMQPRMFPFCSIYKNGQSMAILETSEALRRGNYFLCHTRDEGGPEIADRGEEHSPSPSPQGTRDYRFHVSIEETCIWRNDPPYVNLDRDSDNIGGSSWDGNLTSWFRAGFQSRMLYALHSGLLPED